MTFEPSEYFALDRLEKREKLEEKGFDLYPHEFERTCDLGSYRDQFEDIEEIESGESYRLAGRITGNIRDLGKVSFIDITDESGTVQLFFQEEPLDDYETISDIDRGDFIGVEGTPMRTDTDELSLRVEGFSVLTKALQHPPGRDDLSREKKLRKRAVAMWNDDLHSTLSFRFDMTQKIREYMTTQGFSEVETPILQNIAGGTSARPFVTEANAKETDMHLRIAKELYLKRMAVGGFERIFEIGKDFRNEDIDTTHNPEFTMMEVYKAYADYHDMMELTENVVKYIIDELLNGDYEVNYHKPRRDENGEIIRDAEGEVVTDLVTLDFEPPWPRMTMEEAIEHYAGFDPTELSDEEIREKLHNGGDFPGGFSRGLGIMELFEEHVEHKIEGPVFIIDHPTETTPLCKDHREKEGRIERFEIFAVGAELGNAYTELNDPIQQGEHLAEQVERKSKGDEEAHSMDEDFLDAIAHGMPPTGGLGIGIDRLAMILTDSQSIKRVLPFPMVANE